MMIKCGIRLTANLDLLCQLLVICNPEWGELTKYTNQHNNNKRLTRNGLYMHAYEPTVCHNRQEESTIVIVVFDWLACKNQNTYSFRYVSHRKLIINKHLSLWFSSVASDISLSKIIFQFSLIATTLFIYKQECAIFVFYKCICLYWIKWILLGCRPGPPFC